MTHTHHPSVEHTSCMENLHQLLAYRQSQFVEGTNGINVYTRLVLR